MTKITISKLKESEVEEAAELMGRAFLPTPLPMAVMGGKLDKNLKKMGNGMKMMLTSGDGDVICARDGSQVVGVMRMVKWPECQKPPISTAMLIPALIFIGGAALRVRKFRKIWVEHDPDKPHWHIDPLCVLPERQGQGIGSKLLQYFCDRVDKENQLGYLETDQEANVRLYNRFGFEVREEGPIFGVQNYYMWREAKDK
jgi:ribosomal protein S18 acetylase RimI-like enzyme